MNLLRYCELKILEVVSVVLVVAVLFDSDSKEEEFTGFNIELHFQRNNHVRIKSHQGWQELQWRVTYLVLLRYLFLVEFFMLLPSHPNCETIVLLFIGKDTK